VTVGSSRPPFRYGHDWWRRGVVYQVYPRSFADGDGDGTGDLIGLIERLPYLGPDGLGVDAIWLSPIYPSPGIDIGYDVSDHGAVDPRFGSEADFDHLVAEAHRLGIRVILDLVMNHTSDRHPWFVASRASRHGPHGDWYIWRDPAGVDRDGLPLPPNNWVSWFGGPAWTYDPGRGQFYHHTFLPEQPELDWRIADVERAQFDMVRRWTERGVDGYRLDTFNVFLKHPAMPSNPRRRGSSAWTRQDHRFDFDQPDLPALIGRFRAMVDEAPDRMSVGELFVGTTEGAAALTTDRHLVFDWELLTRPWSAAAFRAAIRRRERAFGPTTWPTAVLSNHDQPRHASRLSASLGAAAGIQDAVAKAAALILLSVRGTPFLYYGEELGLGDVPIPPEESIDAPATRAGPDFAWWDRSAARTPMPWEPGPGGGFTSGTPWLRLGSDVGARNVRTESADPGSVLATYRRVLDARRSIRPLQDGALTLTRTGDPAILGFRRHGRWGEALVLVSFAPAASVTRVPRPAGGGRWRTVAGTHLDLPEAFGTDSTVRLRPYEGIIAVADCAHVSPRRRRQPGSARGGHLRG
jgi:alpha-glucosidase